MGLRGKKLIKDRITKSSYLELWGKKQEIVRDMGKLYWTARN